MINVLIDEAIDYNNDAHKTMMQYASNVFVRREDGSYEIAKARHYVPQPAEDEAEIRNEGELFDLLTQLRIRAAVDRPRGHKMALKNS